MVLSDTVENKILINEYSQVEYPFRKIVSDFCRERLNLGSENLERLHECAALDLLPTDLVTVYNDQDTLLHKEIYKLDPAFGNDNSIDLGFIKTYRKFVRYLQDEVFKEVLVFQKLPTLRIHIPGNMSVGAFHVDSEYNHPTSEINVWVPLTKACGTSSILIESSRGRGDYNPIEIESGNYVIFDSLLMHGNEVNVEDHTRMSFDFRVIPLAKFEDSDETSVSKNRKFAIGDYYDVFND